MLADDFIGIRDAREIDCLIPLNQLQEINEKLPDLLFGEFDTESVGRCNKELAQSTLMFHVEQLREMTKEVKDCLRSMAAYHLARERLPLMSFESDKQDRDGCRGDAGYP